MWQTIIINPLTNILHTLMSWSGDIGVSIILFTIIIKAILIPINISANRTSKNVKRIQPELEKLKQKHKGDHRTLGLELSKLYKEHKIKPLSGLLALLIQIPILIGLYMILVKEIGAIADKITFLDIDVSAPSITLALLSFVAMYYLMKISSEDLKPTEGASEFQKEFTKMMSLQMRYFLPVIVFITSVFIPAGLTLYVFVSSVFGIFQYRFIKNILNKEDPKAS